MRYERLVLQADGSSVTLDLHPRLTVLSHVGADERRALASELLGALRSNTTGVHAEVVDHDGRHLAVFRPTEGRSRVIDVDRVTEVTSEFLDEEGRLDLLRPTGLDLAAIRRKLVLGKADVTTEQHGNAVIRKLASADQATLWTTAERLLRAERNLDEETEATGTNAEDARVIERIEDRHQRLEHALEQQDRVRRLNLAICAAAILGVLVGQLRGNETVVVGFLIAACVSMIAAVGARKRADAAAEAEQEALAEAGVSSYLGFHVQRVEGMLSTEQARKKVLQAAADLRDALRAWQALAGEVSAVWALDHYEEIAGVASSRREIDLRAQRSFHIDLTRFEDASDPARILLDRIAEVSSLGDGESYPLILDDPFAELDESKKPAMLELLSNTSESVQLIYLTDDESVASWARVEALTGTLAIIEPRAEQVAPDRMSPQA